MYLDSNIVFGVGIAILVIGIIFCIFPNFTMSFFTILVGLALLVLSISAIAVWYQTGRGTSAGNAMLVLGILGVICALACLIQPLSTAHTVTWLVALAIVIFGAAQLVSLLCASDIYGRNIAIVGAVIIVVLGICAMVRPQMVVQLVGVALIIEGISVMALSGMARL